MIRTHTVVAGDTLSALAQRYSTTVAELARLNSIANVDLIRVGQVLTLPASSTADAGGAGSAQGTPLQVTVVGGTVAQPDTARQCPSWWPQSACHVWPKMPAVLVVAGLGVIVMLLMREQGSTSPPSTRKRRRRK